MRALIENAINADKEFDLNDISIGKLAAHRSFIESLTPLPVSELDVASQRSLRRQAYLRFSGSNENLKFLKVHDRFSNDQDDGLLFPQEVSALGIYMVRNPLDVAVSFSSHLGASIDETIGMMNSVLEFGAGETQFTSQLFQEVGSWKDHVLSWTTQESFPVRLVRYEDLGSDGPNLLMSIFQTLGMDIPESAIRSAVDNAKFEKLRSLEEKQGFCERPASQKRFFRSGRVGQWREVLTRPQMARIISYNGQVMEQLGYGE
jgi:hypothetical protein